MERRYVPLRPAASLAETDPGAEAADSKQPIEFKGRRVGVFIACDSCRRRKIRCDGRRPICSHCQGRTLACGYRDELNLPQQSTSLVVEIFWILNSLPATEAIQTIKLLKTESDVSIIISTLRDKTSRPDRLPDVDMGTITDDSADPLEFEIQNQIAYPALPPFDAKDLEELPCHGLIESGGRGSAQSFEQKSPESSIPGSQALDKAARDSPSSSPSIAREINIASQLQPQTRPLCDSRLQRLNIRSWTNVDIGNETAAKCISLYLETDHPLLGHFDPELFISHLISGEESYCSPLLINSLLYWACQLYSFIDPRTDALASSFCTEAEILWAIERGNNHDSILNIAAAQFLCLGHLGQGREHEILTYVSEASNMGMRIGLFVIEDGDNMDERESSAGSPEDAMRARMHAAWGTFNWITLISLFRRQPDLGGPKYQPRMTIGHLGKVTTSDDFREHQSLSSASRYMVMNFPHICRLWKILHEVSVVCYTDGQLPWGSDDTLAFAEFKFRELLAWSNTIPSRLPKGKGSPQHVQILHLWFHAAILDIFLPFVREISQGKRPLRTFSSPDITPAVVCASSVTQLKHLITNYRLQYKSSGYTILWHTALIYVINAVLNGKELETCYSDLLLCIYAYESLDRSWRVAAVIAKGLLSLIVQKSDVSNEKAHRIIQDFKNNDIDQLPGEFRAAFMADLNLALSNSGFEDNMMWKDYTTLLDENELN